MRAAATSSTERTTNTHLHVCTVRIVHDPLRNTRNSTFVSKECIHGTTRMIEHFKVDACMPSVTANMDNVAEWCYTTVFKQRYFGWQQWSQRDLSAPAMCAYMQSLKCYARPRWIDRYVWRYRKNSAATPLIALSGNGFWIFFFSVARFYFLLLVEFYCSWFVGAIVCACVCAMCVREHDSKCGSMRFLPKKILVYICLICTLYLRWAWTASACLLAV